jgi:hypothetical protein
MKIAKFYEENGSSWSRNFLQAGAGAAQKWTGSATLLVTNSKFKNLFSGVPIEIFNCIKKN